MLPISLFNVLVMARTALGGSVVPSIPFELARTITHLGPKRSHDRRNGRIGLLVWSPSRSVMPVRTGHTDDFDGLARQYD